MGYLKHLRLSKSSQQKNPVQINEQDLYLFADFVVLVRSFGLGFWIGVLDRVLTNQL